MGTGQNRCVPPPSVPPAHRRSLPLPSRGHRRRSRLPRPDPAPRGQRAGGKPGTGAGVLLAPWGRVTPQRLCPQDPEQCWDPGTGAVTTPDDSAEPGVPDGDEQEEPDAKAEPGPCPDTPKAGQALAGDRPGGGDSVLAVLGCRPSLEVPPRPSPGPPTEEGSCTSSDDDVEGLRRRQGHEPRSRPPPPVPAPHRGTPDAGDEEGLSMSKYLLGALALVAVGLLIVSGEWGSQGKGGGPGVPLIVPSSSQVASTTRRMVSTGDCPARAGCSPAAARTFGRRWTSLSGSSPGPVESVVSRDAVAGEPESPLPADGNVRRGSAVGLSPPKLAKGGGGIPSPPPGLPSFLSPRTRSRSPPRQTPGTPKACRP